MKTIVYRIVRIAIFALTVFIVFYMMTLLPDAFLSMISRWHIAIGATFVLIACGIFALVSNRFDRTLDYLRNSYEIRPIKWVRLSPGNTYLYAIAPATVAIIYRNYHYITIRSGSITLAITAYFVAFGLCEGVRYSIRKSRTSGFH